MDKRRVTQSIDALLVPFLQASDEADSQQVLEQLVSQHAEPRIRSILRHKLRVYLDRAGRSFQDQDTEDVYSEARVQLVERLYELKINPDSNPISNFHSYVAVVTYNAYHEYLRKKYPRRHSLKNELRYLLDHQAGLARWHSEEKEWLCGFAAWRDRKKALALAGRLQQLRDSPRAFVGSMLAHADPQRMNLADLLAEIFTWVGGPVELDDLVNMVAPLRGIKEELEQSERDDEQANHWYERVPDRRAPVDMEVDRRIYLQRLWAEICHLLPRQRSALLLNLRDPKGSSAIDLFVLTGVATIRQIAEVLAMPAEPFAKLWNDLPLDDATIADQLGVTRQQVINLRKSARQRLARRMRALEGNA